MSNNILATGISEKDFLRAFDALVEKRFTEIDLTPLLIYMIDLCPTAALYHLADQFNVLGYKGWVLCTNDEERRALIKKAIELHRYKGTPWAIKEALRSIGFFDAKIQEHAGGIFYDGVHDYDGAHVYGGGAWATFRVQVLDLGETKGISAESLATIVSMINEYKNARSTLVGILFNATVQDIEEISEEFGGVIETAQTDEFLGKAIFYDGTFDYDGEHTYSKSLDEFALTREYDTVEDTNTLPDDSDFQIKIINLAGVTIYEGP